MVGARVDDQGAERVVGDAGEARLLDVAGTVDRPHLGLNQGGDVGRRDRALPPAGQRRQGDATLRLGRRGRWTGRCGAASPPGGGWCR